MAASPLKVVRHEKVSGRPPPAVQKKNPSERNTAARLQQIKIPCPGCLLAMPGQRLPGPGNREVAVQEFAGFLPAGAAAGFEEVTVEVRTGAFTAAAMLPMLVGPAEGAHIVGALTRDPTVARTGRPLSPPSAVSDRWVRPAERASRPYELSAPATAQQGHCRHRTRCDHRNAGPQRVRHAGGERVTGGGGQAGPVGAAQLVGDTEGARD